MKLQYFGDSYDIVKKSMIAWLWEFGPWVTHPMFTEEFDAESAAALSRLLDTPLLSKEFLTPQTGRTEYFSSCLTAGNLFLDPDTGVCLEPRRGKTSVNYVFADELVDLCHARPNALTLIFDQSYSRGSKADHIRHKLSYFIGKRIFGFAYYSHTTFLLLGKDMDLVKRARTKLIEASGLPPFRLIGLEN